MSHRPPVSQGLRTGRQWVVFRPPLVSDRKESVMIDAGAVRTALRSLPCNVSAVALSANPGASEEEERALASLEVVLQEGADGAAMARPASEAVKVVEDGWAVGSVNRASLVAITLPILIDVPVLGKMVEAQDVARWLDPIRAIIRSGGTVRVMLPSR